MLTPFFTPERIFLLYCLVGGFLIGQLQFSFFFSKLKKKDLRHHGTGDYGATNAFRVLGAPLGILTFLCDFGKTVLAIYIATRVLPMHPELVIDFHALVLYTGFGVVLGHIFPVYLKFNGGKGVSCTIATFFCLQDIKLIGVVILVFLVMFLISRYVSLASMVTVFFGSISFMFFMLMRWTYVETDWIFDCQCVLALLFIFCLIAHRSNIVRLVFGDERKFYFRKKKRLEALEEDYTNYDKYYDEVEAEESGLASVEAAILSDEAELAEEVPDEMTEAAEEAAAEAEEAAEEVVEETAEETIEAEESAEETTEESTETAEVSEEESTETVEETEEPAEEGGEEAAEATEESEEVVAEMTEEPVESAEEPVEEASESTEEPVEDTAEESDLKEESVEDTAEHVEETTEEPMTEKVSAEESAEETVEAAAIPLAAFFGKIKSLFRKPEQQDETEVSPNAASMEMIAEDVPGAMDESEDTIEDHLKTKFKDFDITKKVVLSIGGEEQNPEDGQLEETPEEISENETVEKTAGGVFAAGFFGKMRDKLQKVVHPGEKDIPDFLSDNESSEEVQEITETAEETETVVEEAAEEITETVEESAEEIDDTTEGAEEAAEEINDTAEETEEISETAEETAEISGEAVVESAETAEEVATEVVDATTEEAAEASEELTGGVVLPGFFGRMKAKILKSVHLDDLNEDVQEVSDEIEEAADSVFGEEEGEAENVEEPIETNVEKAPSKFAGFLNKVRSILPNQEEELETVEEVEPELVETIVEATEESVEPTEEAPEESVEPIEEAPESQEEAPVFAETVETIPEEVPAEPKVGFFDKLRDKFRDFDISKKIGLSLNDAEEFHEDMQEKREDLHEEISEKVEDLKDSVEEKVTDLHEAIAEKTDDFKETLEEKADDIRHDLEIKEAETKAEIELHTEKVTQDLKETAEGISDDLKKKSDDFIEQTVVPIKKRKLGREARKAVASVTYRQKKSELKFDTKVMLAKWKASAKITAEQFKKK